jgi:hypothetical protein
VQASVLSILRVIVSSGGLIYEMNGFVPSHHFNRYMDRRKQANRRSVYIYLSRVDDSDPPPLFFLLFFSFSLSQICITMLPLYSKHHKEYGLLPCVVFIHTGAKIVAKTRT